MARGFRLGRGRYKKSPLDVDPPPPPPPPSGETEHSFWEEAVASPYHFKSEHLRSQASIFNIHWGIGGLPEGTHTNYVFGSDSFVDPNDGTQIDGAKILMPTNTTNYEQLRMVIGHNATTKGVSTWKTLTAWEEYFDSSFVTQKGVLTTYKAHQFSLATVDPVTGSTTNSGDEIHFEPKTAFMGVDGKAFWPHVRAYEWNLGTGTTKGGAGAIYNGKNYGGDSLGPQVGEFGVNYWKWIRWYVELTFTAGEDLVLCTVWLSDEDRDPVKILDGALYGWNNTADPTGGWGKWAKFWIEFNSSAARTGGPWWMYIRNIVILEQYPDVNYWLRRPTRVRV